MNIMLRKLSENAKARSSMVGEEDWKNYPVPDDVEMISDVAVYGRNPDEVAVDIYRPALLTEESMPVVVFAHGGGLFIGILSSVSKAGR